MQDHALVAVLAVDLMLASDAVPDFVDRGPGLNNVFELVGKVVGWPINLLTGKTKEFVSFIFLYTSIFYLLISHWLSVVSVAR